MTIGPRFLALLAGLGLLGAHSFALVALAASVVGAAAAAPVGPGPGRVFAVAPGPTQVRAFIGSKMDPEITAATLPSGQVIG